MKKIFILTLMGLFINTAANAYIINGETSSVDNLRTQGYSESTLRIIDKLHVKNQSHGKNYQRRFVRKPNNFYTNLKVYLDPIQDDTYFSEHQVNFTNTWMGDETRYSSNVIETNPIENL